MSTYESIPPFSRYGQGDAHMALWQILKDSGYDPDVAPFPGFPALSKGYNAAVFTGATNAAKITNAIAKAVTDGKTYVWIPQTMLPFDPAAISFAGYAVRLIREWGDPSVFDIRAYGATGDGVADDTDSINTAIAAAQAAGRGNIVFCPPCPNGYRINTISTVVVEPGVRLVGGSLSPSRFRETSGIGSSTAPEGTTFVTASTSVPAVTLRTGASCEGIRFWYPNQVWNITSLLTPLVSYPAAIQIGDATFPGTKSVTIRDCEFLGATRCIGQYATDGTATGEIVIENCRGVLLGEFLRVARSSDVIHVRHCHFTPNAVSNYVGDGTVGGDVQIFRTKAAQASKVFHLGNVDDIEVHDVFAFGVLYFAHWNNGFYSGDPNTGGGGTFVNCATDGAHQGFRVERSSNSFPISVIGGWYVTNFRPNGVAGDSPQQGLLYIATGMTNLRVQISALRNNGAAVTDFVAAYSGNPDYAFPAPGAPGSGVNVLVGQCSFGNQSIGLVNAAVVENVRLVSPVSQDVMKATQDGVRFVLTDAATIVVDALSGNYQQVTLTASGHTVGSPTNSRQGQRLTFGIVQDGTGGRTLLWNAVFKHAWSDTGNTLSKRSTISFVFDGTNWVQDGAQSPYLT